MKAINSSCISVRWGKPDKSVLHGNLARYEIEYRRVKCNESDNVNATDGSWKSVEVASTSLYAEIGSLMLGSCYEVRMRAVTVGNGPYSDIMEVRVEAQGEVFVHSFCTHIMTCNSVLHIEKNLSMSGQMRFL